MKTNVNYLMILSAFIVMSLFPFDLSASRIILESNLENKDELNNVIYEGDYFTISLFADTEKEYINAIETEILFDSSLVSFESWNSGDSSINFWLDEPSLIKKGTIYLSGVTPGGIIGDRLKVVDLIFKAKTLIAEKNSLAAFRLSNPFLFINDGSGTKSIASHQTLELSIFDDKSDFGDNSNSFSMIEILNTDKEPPEVFNPSIISDDKMFSGKNFIVFLTQDKVSGVNRYEIKEGNFDFFKKVESPYVLRNQNLNSRIYLKAIDNAGNERLVLIEPQNQSKSGYQSYLILGIIILVCVLAFSIKSFSIRSLTRPR